MKVISICNNRTLEVNIHPFCTEETLSSTHKHRISDEEASGTCKSDSYLHFSGEGMTDIAHVTHCNPSENMVMSINGIDDFFYMRLHVDNKKESNMSSDETCYPCNDVSLWCSMHTHHSCSKSMLVSFIRAQEETQKMLMRSSMVQTTYCREASKIHTHPDAMHCLNERALLTSFLSDALKKLNFALMHNSKLSLRKVRKVTHTKL